MNYQTIFQTSDVLDRNNDFRFVRYPQGGDTQFQTNSRYPMLFVLRGTVELRFKYCVCPIEAGNLVVFAAEQLLTCTTTPGTIVLLYRPPRRLVTFLEQSNKLFDTPHSEIVPILEPLQEWIDMLVEEQGKDPHEQRYRLAQILMKSYPRRQLGELYVPFSICVLGNCKLCSMPDGEGKTILPNE